MKIENQSPATAQAEQATAYAAGIERVNIGMKPRGLVTPYSNGGTKEKE